MSDDNIATLRRHVVALLEGGHAFAKPARILGEVPLEARGTRVEGFEHTLWQLLEHMRIDQRDILDFCVAAEYSELEMPDDYWPQADAPASDDEWNASVASYLENLDEAKRITLDDSIDLFAIVPRGTTQTWLRLLIAMAEHSAHHLGQFIMLRKMLGVW